MPADSLLQKSSELTLAEELVVLLLNENEGHITALSPNWRLWCGFAGSVLLDLSLQNRLDVDLEGVKVIDATPTGNPLLDPFLSVIREEEKVRGPRYWVERFAHEADGFIDNVLERLVREQILVEDSAGFWSLSDDIVRKSRHADASAGESEEVRDRIRRAILSDELPHPHDVTLIALLQACDGFRAILDVDEYEATQDRITLLAGLDLFGQAILQSVSTTYQPPTSLFQSRVQALPKVSLLDCLKSKSFREKNLPKFLAEMYQRYGPVFAWSTPFTKAVVLVGPEMNRWVNRRGRLFLRTRDYIQDFLTAWGAGRTIASMDGAEHFRMRKLMRAGTSRAVVENRLDEVFDRGRANLNTWQVGETLPGEITMQRFIGRQISQLSVSVEPSDQTLDDLQDYEFRALLVHVLKILPAFTLKTRRMKRALNSVHSLYEQIHASHTPGQREGMPPDLVDDLVGVHDSDPQFLPITDLGFFFIAAIIAGHYSASAMSFAVYELLEHPDMWRKVTEEADALFKDGDPTFEQLTMESIDFTHRFIMEVLRLHPVIPFHFRTAMNSFEVEKFRIPERQSVMLPYASCHFLDEFFENPDAFDPDRYLEPRSEHRQPGIYQPFGIGTHACLGNRFTEFHMVSCLLLITHHLELELMPKNYKLKLSPLPKYSPDKGFKFRVSNVRHPLAT